MYALYDLEQGVIWELLMENTFFLMAVKKKPA